MATNFLAHLLHSHYYCKLLGEANKEYQKGGDGIQNGLSIMDLNTENIKKGRKWAEQNSKRDPRAAYLCSAYPDVGAFILPLRLRAVESIVWRKSALDVSKSLGLGDKVIGVHYSALGRSYREIADFQQAKECFNKALKLHERANNYQGMANNFGNLGVVSKDVGEFELAIKYYKKALLLHEQLGDDRGIQNEVGNIGTLYMELGLPSKAIYFLNNSLSISEKLGDLQSLSIALLSMGEAFSLLGDQEKAFVTLERALKLCQAIGNKTNECKILGNLGNAYYRSGNFDSALEMYFQTADLEKEVGNELGVGKALFNIAHTYESMNDRDKAIFYAEKSVESFQRLNHPGILKVAKQLSEWRKGKF